MRCPLALAAPGFAAIFTVELNDSGAPSAAA